MAEELPLKIRASYGGGRRVQVGQERLKWILEPAEGIQGLKLQDGRVRAQHPTETPLKVQAELQGQLSNTVSVSAVGSRPLTLVIKAGYLYVSEAPGLVIDIDEKQAAKYPCDLQGGNYGPQRSPNGSILGN